MDDLYNLVRDVIWEATALPFFGDALGAAGSEQLAASLEDFTRFDGKFPLLMAGVPPAALGECGEAMRRLRGLFAGGAASIREASDMIHFRQKWL